MNVPFSPVADFSTLDRTSTETRVNVLHIIGYKTLQKPNIYICNSFLGFLALDFTKSHNNNLHYLQLLEQLPLLSMYMYFVAYEYIRTRTGHYMYSVQ